MPTDSLRTLLVEDDVKLAELIERGLREAGMTVEHCGDGETALERIRHFDACVLDVRLPKKDGFTVVEIARKQGIATPILMLTARDAVQDRVHGLELGADDYLTKPFALPELVARLRAIARRATKRNVAVFQWGDIVLDAVEHTVQRNGVALELSAKQFLLLLALLRHGRDVATRSMLLRDVFGYSYDPGTNIVDVHVAQLRKRIDRSGESSMIETVRGVGYRMAEFRKR